MQLYPIQSLKKCTKFFQQETKYQELDDLKTLSCLFWKELLSTENVKDLLDFSYEFNKDADISPNIKRFIKSDNIEDELNKILKIITSIGIENAKYFEAIELVSYLLMQFSEFYYHNLTFTIDNAFDIEANSILQITELAKSTEYNPYYEFLEKYFVPILQKETPELIFVNGRPNLFNFSQVYFVKKLFPNTQIFISQHSTEYYSLNKIVKYLKNNELLFSWIDGIILDDFKYTEKLIIKAISEKQDLSTVPNLMYKTHTNIIQTEYKKRKRSINEIEIPNCLLANNKTQKIISPLEIFETILLQNNKCHWSGCSYCGINAKYPTKFNDRTYSVNDYSTVFEEVKAKGYKLLVLQDEAIPVEIANQIALEKIDRNNDLAWHYRSKIDINYTDEIIDNLAKSNLKGIYFGLESINNRVLHLMNKYENYNISPNYIENLADRLFAKGIQCHFCCIIGFPGETREELNETLNFIAKIKSKHSAFTFTVNIFEPDIAAPLFTKKEKYNLSAQLPVADNLYIGNSLLFEREIPYEELVEIKIKFLIENISDSNETITEVMENANSLINYINAQV